MNKVSINEVSIAYERHGTGTPLVLLHGFPLDHSSWNEAITVSENDFDIILPDLRGFGQSATMETLTQFLICR